MNDLLAMPEPVQIIVPMRVSYGTIQSDWIDLYPYRTSSWQETAARFQIQIPERIISLADGTSVCEKCKAVYAGRQFVCEHPVPFFTWQGKYARKERGYKNVGDSYGDSWENGKVTKITWESCASTNLQWNLQEAFSFQQSFFNLLDKIGQMPNVNNSPLEPFKDLMSPATYALLDLNLLRERMNTLEYQQAGIVAVIKDIAARMSQAGTILNIGNL